MKKLSRKSLITKLDGLVSKIVRERDGACVVCGQVTNLQAGHVFSRRHYATRWDLLNVHTQCSGCNFRHNGDAVPYYSWFVRKFGQEEFDRLHDKHIQIKQFKDFQLQELLEELKAL